MPGVDIVLPLELVLESTEQTQSFGERLAEEFFKKKPLVVKLCGELGSGKTTFARGFISRWLELSGEKVPNSIISPTFSIVQSYGFSHSLLHFDFYRLNSWLELEQIGFEEQVRCADCCLVEWAEKIPETKGFFPGFIIHVLLEFGENPQSRKFKYLVDTPDTL